MGLPPRRLSRTRRYLLEGKRVGCLRQTDPGRRLAEEERLPKKGQCGQGVPVPGPRLSPTYPGHTLFDFAVCIVVYTTVL